MSAGRSFATNGPMLTFMVNRQIPGGTVEVLSARPLQVTAEADAREPIDRIEVIANGRVVASTSGSRLQSEIEPKNYTWVAARSVFKTDRTLRFANTSPIYLSGEQQSWDGSEDKAYFRKWIDDLIAESKADPRRFANLDQKHAVIAVYRA